MEPNRVEFQKQCIFQSFCKRVLHNEACNAHEEIRRRSIGQIGYIRYMGSRWADTRRRKEGQTEREISAFQSRLSNPAAIIHISVQ